MKSTQLFQKISLTCALVYTLAISAQKVTGKIFDSKGNALPFVNIVEKKTKNGTTSNIDGSFQIILQKQKNTLEFSYVGYTTTERDVTAGEKITITLKEGFELENIVITANRAKPRTITDSPVPIDNIGISELQNTGQTSIDKMLTFSVPSYNASNQAVSDATAHFDPSDLRGLGPSRTLVLINGKRKNQSSLVYVADVPGKGEVGTDIKSIPKSAIKNVEVLRDGASAQYGSDAVAGVINIILKKNAKFTTSHLESGITKEGDGFNVSAGANHTFNFGNNGFINASIGGLHQKSTNRAGNPGKDILFGAIYNDNFEKEYANNNISLQEYNEGISLAKSLTDGSHPWIQKNPSLGMNIGQPEITKGNIFLNSELAINDNTKIYAFGGFNLRKGTSYALYRTPYWKADPHNLLHKKGTEYNGFQPTFETVINDIFVTTGSNFKFYGFNADLSATYGSNTVDYTAGNTLNSDLGANSPTKFNVGGYGFNNIIGNFDINKSFGNISFGAGIEAKQENFTALAGQKESYYKDGAQSFPGLRPSNVVDEKRTNIGTYLTSDWDVSKKILFSGAIRYENFSDFGGNLSWKLSSRYRINKTGVLRASYSTGFRAPSLHQIYFSTKFTLPGEGGELINQGIFKNTDKAVKDLGVKDLFAETSRSLSGGFTVKPSSKLTISLDYYNIKVSDRVLLSGQITKKNDLGQINPDVEKILKNNRVKALAFFFNTLNTTTQGFDYSIRYKNLRLGNGRLGLNTSLNVNHTTLNGTIKVPTKLETYKETIFNREEQSRITSARPNLKFLYGANFKINNFNFAVNNTYFGKVTWKHAKTAKKDQTFAGKTLTDISLGYRISNQISINLNINNILDIYPESIDAKGDLSTNLGGRFKHPWEVNQFGFNGATFKAGINFKF